MIEAEEAFWREVTEVVLKGEIPVLEKEDDRHGRPTEVTHRLHEYFGGQLPLKIVDPEVPSDLLIYRHLSVLVHENKRHRVAAVNVKKNVTGRTGDLHRYLCRHLLHM